MVEGEIEKTTLRAGLLSGFFASGSWGGGGAFKQKKLLGDFSLAVSFGQVLRRFSVRKHVSIGRARS